MWVVIVYILLFKYKSRKIKIIKNIQLLPTWNFQQHYYMKVPCG